MKLSDVVSAMHLSIFATVPLLIFFGIFIGVTIHLLSGHETFERARQLPLQRSDAEKGDGQ
jgi:cbb3-type cytochrome oxidase subunit 3